ncbi:11242_t:CDS:2, partial [Gigaspora margarita]
FTGSYLIRVQLIMVTKPLMPKVNDEFESLEAFENAAKSAAKYEGFALLRKDSNLTGCNNKSAFVTTKAVHEHDYSMIKLDEVVAFPQYRAMIFSKDIINKCARIRLALNEGYNNDSTQKLLRLFEKPAKCVAKCPEVLIVDSTYRANVYKYTLVSAVGINNISNERGDKSEASYIWFLQTLRAKIYNAYGCLPDVFMSDRDQTASDLESVFRQIDQTKCLQHLKAAVRTGSNKIAINPFTLRNPVFNELIGKVSTWAIDHIKRTLQKKPTIYMNAENCMCLAKINYKLSCQHMIPMHSPIPLSIINKRWLLNRQEIIELPCSSKSSMIDSEFYDTFINAEKKF